MSPTNKGTVTGVRSTTSSAPRRFCAKTYPKPAFRASPSTPTTPALLTPTTSRSMLRGKPIWQQTSSGLSSAIHCANSDRFPAQWPTAPLSILTSAPIPKIAPPPYPSSSTLRRSAIPPTRTLPLCSPKKFSAPRKRYALPCRQPARAATFSTQITSVRRRLRASKS